PPRGFPRGTGRPRGAAAASAHRGRSPSRARECRGWRRPWRRARGRRWRGGARNRRRSRRGGGRYRGTLRPAWIGMRKRSVHARSCEAHRSGIVAQVPRGPAAVAALGCQGAAPCLGCSPGSASGPVRSLGRWPSSSPDSPGEHVDVTVLAFHAVTRAPLDVPHACFLDRAAFRLWLRRLKRRYDVVSLAEAVDGRPPGPRGRPRAVITLDDGLQDSCDVALPILQEAGVPATVFLVTGLVDTDHTLWFCRLHRALTQT